MAETDVVGQDLTELGIGAVPYESGSRLAQALRHPQRAVRYVLAHAVGAFYRVLFSITRPGRFIAGSGLQVRGRLVVRGPGTVILGDNVQIWGRVTPWTYTDDAVISIGSNSVLDGSRFGCHRRITIGDNCRIADCRMIDTDFHPVQVNREDRTAPIRVSAIEIGENVWIAGMTGILPGTSIGRDSIVSFGAVCSGSFGDGMIIVGNPARVATMVPQNAITQESEPLFPAASSAPQASEAPVRQPVATPAMPPAASSAATGLNALIAEALGLSGDDIDDALSYDDVAQWDSFGHLALMTAIEARYGVRIEDDLVVSLTSVRSIREFVEALPPRAG